MQPIFRDDSAPADRREACVSQLMDMCPQPYRPLMRPVVVMAIQNATDAEVEGLLTDIKNVRVLAEQGDMTGIADIARRYGASDDAINSYLPLFAGTGAKRVN